MIANRISLSFLLLFITCSLSAQDNIKYEDWKYDQDIGAITFNFPGQYFSYPILSLNSGTQLQLIFDDFAPNLRYFSYKIIHCDKNWKPSDIPTLDYLDGYETDDLQENVVSFNTRAEYISHNLLIPNDEMKLKISGNYVLYVWDDDTNEPVLTRRFMISEDKVRVMPQVVAPSFVDKRRTHQEVKFNVSVNNYPINNAERELSATMLQNGKWQDAYVNIEPRFQQGDIVNFEYIGEHLFPGGNEYRLIDLRSTQFANSNIYEIEYFSDGFYVVMNADHPRNNKAYYNYIDLNGKFAVLNSDDLQTGRRISATDDTTAILSEVQALQGLERDRILENAARSDYASVEFTLMKSYELVDRDVYVVGAFNGWAMTEDSRMVYKEGAYRCTQEVKQGIADYCYATTPKGSNKADYTELEGSSFETRNEYLILIYQRSAVDRHDRLVGFRIFDSR